MMAFKQRGSISEAMREEETLRYGASLLAESVINDSATPLAQCRRPATASSDPALAAFAQLAALRLNAGRTLISLFDGKRQYVVAEATQTTAIELDTGGGDDHDDDEGRPPGAGDAPLLLSGTAVPRHRGTCEHVLDLPAVAQDPGDDLLPISVVPDLARDDRFAGRSLFGPAPPSGFYAGVPLRSPQGIDIGVCCVLDDEPRRGLGAPDRRFLRHIGRLVMSHLQSRVSTESYRRNERMVRGLGSMVEGGGSIARWRGEPNPKSFHDVDGTEGSLNLRQQRIQEFHRRRYSPATPRPVVTPVQPEPTAEDDAEGERPTDSTDTVDTISEFKSFTSYPGKPKDEYQAVKALFARTANIIRESIEIEGALFLDAAIESFGGLVSNDVESQQRSEGSSGEESVATDDSILQQEYCRVLGFSTSTNSSINGDTTPEEHTMVPDTFLEKILRRYREGQVFNFDDDGAIIWAVSDSEESFSDNSEEMRKKPEKSSANRPRKSDCTFITRMFPGARSVALIPLWDPHQNRWFAGGFVWTKSRGRVFSAQGELSYLKAFCSATMSEVSRLDALRETKAKEDVLGSLSHEIRSPLHGIILGVELMHDSVMTGFQEDVLHTVEISGRTLLDTLDHLLDFSKVNHFMRSKKQRYRGLSAAPEVSVEAGMMSAFSDTYLDLLVEEVIETVSAGYSFQSSPGRWAGREGRTEGSYFQQAGTMRRLEAVRQIDSSRASPGVPRVETSVDVWLSIDPHLSWAFYAQPGAFRRIFMNLFGNALKYTSKGSILISLTQEPATIKKKSRRRTVVFSVSDSGQGISSEYLREKLFTPFSQENQLSSGAGLGLSLVKQIVHGLGGRISVESRVGFGTTVRTSIPLRMSSPRSSPSPPSSQANRDLSQLLGRLDGVPVALLGFPDAFGAERPLAVGHSAAALSPMVLMRTLCSKHLRMHVLTDREALSTLPSLYICTEKALGQVAVLGGHASPPPVVVVCDSVLSAHELAGRFARDPPQVVRECTSQPVGPRKLSKILGFALTKWKESQNEGHVARQAPSPVSAVNTNLEVPTTPTEEWALSPDELAATSPVALEHVATPLALPHRTLVQAAVGVENGVEDSPTAVPGAVRSRQQEPPHTQGSLEATADFLLVDDSEINLKILTSYMKKLGRRADNAMNGLEALEACVKRPTNYRCIFMDISMPVMDGLESTRRIRAHERQNGLQPALIVALTGLASAKNQKEAFASGIDLFLTKPVPLKELSRILETKGV